MASSALIGEVNHDGYRKLFEEIFRRLRSPGKNPTFAIFFVTTLICYSGSGLWLELAKYWFDIGTKYESGIRSAVASYFPAIAGGVAMQLAISEEQRSLRALGQLVAWLLGSMSLVLVLAPSLPLWLEIVLGISGTLVALAFWWIVNADKPDLQNEVPPPVAATGGQDSQRALSGGSALANFVH